MKQQSLFDSELQNQDDNELELIRFPQLPDAELAYYPQFLAVERADHYLTVLRESLAWKQEQIQLYGKSHLIPRLQAWYGDPEAKYQYSGLPMQPVPWTKELLELKLQCEYQLTCSFNSVLANWYRDGNDSMGFHADNEPELGAQPVIAAVSLGQERVIRFRHKNKKDTLALHLQHGSLLVMAGNTQSYWQHGISKSKRTLNDRISLTFRRVFPSLITG
ncbi:alpha-ketoglutarate-dependent dioxygenase AlkB [Paraneptunicella aestuarii]|uniref:alpha-ketoglutarate-dependent dioxygenase AlkB family protein n=1 Tax=Paraneptunicella aestuarii TaxID=2831148 RepID=UPI001E63DD62|nr:alpha-ketoglutarate-dependent dioxygenase AlkB [Paraneptunicella aestuarii]UAA39559.1 alpha-ketoglutarate-dependent dioxygenase AlkB [Paraneptunicella aestuarii]